MKDEFFEVNVESRLIAEKAVYDDSKHPRDEGGRWTTSGTGAAHIQNTLARVGVNHGDQVAHLGDHEFGGQTVSTYQVHSLGKKPSNKQLDDITEKATRHLRDRGNKSEVKMDEYPSRHPSGKGWTYNVSVRKKAHHGSDPDFNHHPNGGGGKWASALSDMPGHTVHADTNTSRQAHSPNRVWVQTEEKDPAKVKASIEQHLSAKGIKGYVQHNRTGYTPEGKTAHNFTITGKKPNVNHLHEAEDIISRHKTAKGGIDLSGVKAEAASAKHHPRTRGHIQSWLETNDPSYHKSAYASVDVAADKGTPSKGSPIPKRSA